MHDSSPSASPEVNYSKLSTTELRKLRNTVVANLSVLDQRSWGDPWMDRALREHPDSPVWEDVDLPDWARELLRLELASSKIDLELSRRGELIDPSKAVGETGESVEARPASGTADFTYSPDYHDVTIRGKEYKLTRRQAQMVKILHKTHKSWHPEVVIRDLLEQVGTPNSVWQDTWRSNPDAREALIKIGIGASKGTLRLNA